MLLIRSELLALGIKSVDMIRILDKEYGIKVSPGNYSLVVNGKAHYPAAARIRNACWDYIEKHKRKEK